jgi:hypothetical protein
VSVAKASFSTYNISYLIAISRFGHCVNGISFFWDVTQRTLVYCVWNVMAHTQKPDFAFRRKGRVHLNRQKGQFSRLLAGELCASACRVCTTSASLCSAVMWRLLVTHSILLFSFHFSAHASPCAITFQTQSSNLPTFLDKYRSYLQAPSSPKTIIQVDGYPEKSINNYQYTTRNIPEYWRDKFHPTFQLPSSRMCCVMERLVLRPYHQRRSAEFSSEWRHNVTHHWLKTALID